MICRNKVMNISKIHFLVLLLISPLLMLAQSPDFEVRNFHENTTDLSAATSQVKDLNGVTAALVRFAVRDTLFQFETNLGILKQENKTGEVLLYVPHGTKKLTIRHPYLGILRDYLFPVAIKSKTTYDTEVTITNLDYLNKKLDLDLNHSDVVTKADKKTLFSIHRPPKAKPIQKSVPSKKRFTYKYEDVNFDCRVREGDIVITGFDVKAKNVVIPSQVEYDGSFYPVTEVSTFINGNNYDTVNLVIQDGIRKIGNYSFVEFRKLKNVSIPSSVNEIGKKAFYDHKGLTFELPPGISESDLRKGNKILK